MIPNYDDLYKSISADNVSRTLLNVLFMTSDEDEYKPCSFDTIKESMLTLEERLFIKSLNLDIINKDYDMSTNTYCNKNMRIFYLPDNYIKTQDGRIDPTGIRHYVFKKHGVSGDNTFYTVVFDKRFKGDDKKAFKLCRYIIDLYLLSYNNNDPNYSFSTLYFDDIITGSIVQFEYCAAVFKALDKALNLKFNDYNVFVKDEWYNYKIDGVELNEELLSKIYTWAITTDNDNAELDRKNIIEDIFDYNMKENIM